MSPADLAKLVTNAIIGLVVAALVIFAHVPWQTGVSVLVALLVPSAAPTILDLLRPKDPPAT